MQDAPDAAGSQTTESGQRIIEQLRAGKLPQMVDWFNPIVLSMVAVRTLISSTVGEYADQRPMQEAADGERKAAILARRHDYSQFDPDDPNKLLPPDADTKNPYYSLNEAYGTDDDMYLYETRKDRRLVLDKGALWVDFIADLGDGFEATYAMAYLLAAPELEVRGTGKTLEKLPAGQILIFGGDLAYPNATEEEYRSRCLEPYQWAFTRDPKLSEPPRELFFIAGNHDWYDGLAAFTNQFCYETSSFGGWRCRQQRSYFALQLPYRWWFWGIDVALGDSLDVAQRNYFRDVAAEQMQKGDKVIIVLHAPDWFKPEYKALTLICQHAREKGAEVCAIIAGDLHHYTKYVSESTKLQLITSGGGGAFTHPTHDLKKDIEIHQDLAGTGPVKRVREVSKRALRLGLSSEEKQGPVPFSGKTFYPTRHKSRFLALKNLLLPLHNWRFAVFMGIVYMIYAWVFQIAVSDPTSAMRQAQYVSIEMQCRAENPPEAANACSQQRKSAFDKKLDQLAAPRDLTPEARVHWRVLTAQFSLNRILDGMLASPAFFFLVAALWIGLIQYVDVTFESWLQWPIKVALGSAHAGAHLFVLLATNSVLGIIYDRFAESQSFFERVSGIGLYTLLMILVGGVLGAFVFGIYWVLTSILFGMHADAFSALGIRHYKNFLRMKFEADKLTIYPIALDKVPGRRMWRAWNKARYPEDSNLAHRPRIVPKKPLKPRLIEDPFEIRASVSPKPVLQAAAE